MNIDSLFIYNGVHRSEFKTEKELEKTLSLLSDFSNSIVFFIPANKINFYIKNFKIFFRDRNIMIAREMTKIHESFYRDKINSIKSFKNSLKGELTVVISNIDSKNKTINEEKIINKAMDL